MPPKDYATRPRVNKQKSPEPKPQLPWIRIIITLSLIVGFGYFLWVISQGDKPSTPAQQAPTSAAQVPAENLAPLPDIPEEEWEFFTLLPDTEVKVQVTEEANSDKRYLMQCGSFRQRYQAERMQAKMAMQGMEPIIRSSNGGRWYRVILGPYDKIRQAEVDKHQLQQIDINGCQIWTWNLSDLP